MLIDKSLPENYVRNERHHALINIYYTSQWITNKVIAFLEKEDLTPQQYNILRILHHMKIPLTTFKIRELMFDKMSDTSRIVERMQKKQLVNKITNKKDKRLVDVTLSPTGTELVIRLEKEAESLDRIINRLDKDEIKQLEKLLNKMRGDY